ncbi:hypothetical protein DMB45_08710 [Sanguibacteroides justesenii]|uniref:Uncharacterized protein n=1 Tax=Sanguibacteroides justesenii TaxID=1547597 RepID=A0A0C3RK87_9PORP|nr:hypothetical protein BA92_02835 [Sanguibacteroides justesenii]KIO46810.1 hypothetical protein IE90_01935 [Sanguibacteroides justesenii]PXZ43434.1 hypothetical protein DMB45_08710 [Sanguibacteroides justesenii]
MGGEFLLKIGVKKFGKKEDEIISLSPFSEENGLTPGEERYNGKAGKKFEKKWKKIWREWVKGVIFASAFATKKGGSR